MKKNASDYFIYWGTLLRWSAIEYIFFWDTSMGMCLE